jgi:hypothetical protein
MYLVFALSPDCSSSRFGRGDKVAMVSRAIAQLGRATELTDGHALLFNLFIGKWDLESYQKVH